MEFKIFQMKTKSQYCFRELPESILNNKIAAEIIEIESEKMDYQEVYNAEIQTTATNHSVILEELFRIFNIDHPEDYKARSLSVSDIVQLEGNYYICQSVGWKKLN